MIFALLIIAGGVPYAHAATAVNLGAAGNYAILAETAVTTTGTTHIIGDIGLSPAAASYFAGFSQTLACGGTCSTSSLVTGHLYAADYASPTPANLNTAVTNMGTAYTNANGQPTSVTMGTTTLGGQTLATGVYTWTTNAVMTGSITLSGSSSDVWIFKIPGTLTVNSGDILLSGGAIYKNVFWVVGGQTTLQVGVHFQGIILDYTSIAMQTGATLVGRALAQAAVTLDANTITAPGAPTTTTSVSCSPSSVGVGSDSICTATVTGSSPTGIVTFSQSSLNDGIVTFSSLTCTLSAGSCAVTATGAHVGSVTVSGFYGGDPNNAASSGTFYPLAVTLFPTPTLVVTPDQGPTGVTTTLSGQNYLDLTTYNYCFESGVTSSPSHCPATHQFKTTNGGAIPSSTTLAISGSTGLVVVSDLSSAVITSAVFTITTPVISLVPSYSSAGSSVIVTGTGFSVSTAVGTFTYAGSTPATQTCTSQTTSSHGTFSCIFTVPSSSSGPHTVTASGSDVGSVSADTASATFTIPASPATVTSVSCSPSYVVRGRPSICTATVTGSSPTGVVTFSQSSLNDGAVTFSSSTCTLSAGSCSVTATGAIVGSVTVSGVYGGDTNNAASSSVSFVVIAVSIPEFPVVLAIPVIFLAAAAIYLFTKSRIPMPK